MSKRIVYLGPNNNHMKEKLKEKSLNYLQANMGDRFFYLLPNRELLSHYRNEFIDKLEAGFNLNFITFDDIVNEIMKDNAVKIASDPIKNIIMRKVIRDLEEKSLLNYYKNFIHYDGFIESCIYIIGSIKKSLIRPKEYLQKCGSLPFYREIGLIYEAYEDQLKEKDYLDRDSLYLESIEILKNKRGFLKNLDFIIIDEFYDFRPIELQILNLLKDSDADIYINIPFKTKGKNRRLKETIIALESMGFEIDNLAKEELNDFEELANILFDDSSSTVSGDINLIKASSLDLEIKYILKEIKNNYNYHSIDLDENCICIFNKEYETRIIKQAKKENLPISIDDTVSLMNLPMTKEIINIIELSLYAGERESFLNRIKSAYLPICDEDERDILEYVLRKSKFQDIYDLYDRIQNEKTLDIPEKYLKTISDIIQLLKDEIIILEKTSSLKGFNENLLKIIDTYGIENKILDRYQINKNFKLLQRDLSSLKLIKNLLTNIEAVNFTNEEINLEEYLAILLDYFQEELVREEKGNPKGIKVVTIDNARGMNYRRVFIAGLTKGIYPDLMNKSFFLSDDKYHELRKIGVDIKDYKNRLDNEILKFKSLISSCKEKLYISCNFQAEGDENPLYSIFLDEVLEKLSGDKEEDKLKLIEIGLDFLYENKIEKISSEDEFTMKLLNDYYYDRQSLDELKYHNKFYPGKIDRINLQLESGLNTGALADEYAKDYINNIFINNKFSVSFLENYSICPYAFLMKNIFHIEGLEREIQDYSPMDMGSIYHEVLRTYYEKYRTDLSDIDEFNYLDSQSFIRESLLEETAKYGYRESSNKDLLLLNRMENKIKGIIEKDIERLSKHKDVKPYSFEEWFNMDFLLDNKSIEVRGIIDRIDRVGEDKYIIIDYKSSDYSKRTIKDIENKISLQLPIYIMSQKNRNIVGAFYGVISPPNFSTCMGLLGETSLVTSRQAGAMDREKWDEVLLETKVTMEDIIKEISAGNFSVEPRYCSEFCIYKDICRYDKTKEVE